MPDLKDSRRINLIVETMTQFQIQKRACPQTNKISRDLTKWIRNTKKINKH